MNTTFEYNRRTVEIESMYGNSAYTQYSAFVDGYSVSPIPRVTVQMAEKDAKQYIDAEIFVPDAICLNGNILDCKTLNTQQPE